VLSREAPVGRRLPEPAARTLAAVAATAAIALAIAACGDGEDDGASANTSDAATDLQLTLDPDGEGGEGALEAKLTCPGDEAAACDAVAALPADPAAPVPPQTACTELYGGPDTLAITGTLDGEPVDATFTRANGCEIERFDRFAKLLGELYPDYEPGGSLTPQ
jgi:hypothetical protein